MWRRLLPALALGAAAFANPAPAAADRPGDFDYYVLALSWAPAYCETEARGKRDPQCAGPRHYAFVLHGLWPQYERGWPSNCDIGKRPWIPETVIRKMMDIMPAKGLIIHQYRKHGTCSGLTPEDYFEVSRRLFDKVRVPARYLEPRQSVIVSPEQIETDFLKTNPALKPEMISVYPLPGSCGVSEGIARDRPETGRFGQWVMRGPCSGSPLPGWT